MISAATHAVSIMEHASIQHVFVRLATLAHVVKKGSPIVQMEPVSLSVQILATVTANV
jgi:hypothetical protein